MSAQGRKNEETARETDGKKGRKLRLRDKMF